MARRPRFSRGEARRDALIEAPRRAARLVGCGVEGEAHLEVGHVRAEEAHGAPAHGLVCVGARSGLPTAQACSGGLRGWPAVGCCPACGAHASAMGQPDQHVGGPGSLQP